MKNLMRKEILILSVLTSLFSFQVRANWGMGMYGMMPVCPYDFNIADSQLGEIADEIDEVKTRLKELEDERRELKTSSLESKVKRHESYIKLGLKTGVASAVIDHLKSRSTNCEDYSASASCADIGEPAEAGESSVTSSDSFCVNGRNKWPVYCHAGGVRIQGSVCYDVDLRKSGSDTASSKCSEAVEDYLADLQELDERKSRLTIIEDEIKLQKDLLKQLNKDFREEAKDSGLQTSCPECLVAQMKAYRPPSTVETIANVAGGVLTGILGYQAQKRQMDINARLGWGNYPGMVGSPWASLLGGFVQGAIAGGIGQGAFGCGGMMGGPMGMSGMFGANPGLYGMMNPSMSPFMNPYTSMMGPGGGMFLPGFTPWGMNGPFSPMMGGAGYGFLGGFASFPGGFGGGMAPMGGMGMMPMGGMGMAPMMGGIIGGIMGGPMGMGMMPMGGMGMAPMMGGMMPMGGMGMAPMMGGMMPMGGMGMAPMMGGIAGGIMGGFPGFGGGMAPMGGMGMAPMGGMGMAPMMGGIAGGFPGFNGMGMMGGQMQLQLMQQQMQAYQYYAQAQMRYYEHSMARFNVVMGLYAEMSSLQMRINQAMMGIGGAPIPGFGGPTGPMPRPTAPGGPPPVSR